MLGTTEPDEKDIWIGWCGRCFTNEASNEICIAISVRKILSFNVTKLMEQRPISWAISGGNGSWHGKPTRRIMAFVLQGQLKWRRCPLTKKICPLLTFAFGTKKTFAGSERIGQIDLNSRNQQSTSDVGCWFSVTMIRVRGCPLMILLEPLLTLLL